MDQGGRKNRLEDSEGQEARYESALFFHTHLQPNHNQIPESNHAQL